MLVPGAGLGRLAYELSWGLGHRVTALDCSALMISATSAILAWTEPEFAGTINFFMLAVGVGVGVRVML